MTNPERQVPPPIIAQVKEALELALVGFNHAYFGEQIPDDCTSAVECALAAIEKLAATYPIQETPSSPPGERRP